MIGLIDSVGTTGTIGTIVAVVTAPFAFVFGMRLGEWLCEVLLSW